MVAVVRADTLGFCDAKRVKKIGGVRCGVTLVPKSKVNPRVITRTGGILSEMYRGCDRGFSCARILLKKTSVSTRKMPLARRTVTRTGTSSTMLVNSVNNSTGASP